MNLVIRNAGTYEWRLSEFEKRIYLAAVELAAQPAVCVAVQLLVKLVEEFMAAWVHALTAANGPAISRPWLLLSARAHKLK